MHKGLWVKLHGGAGVSMEKRNGQGVVNNRPPPTEHSRDGMVPKQVAGSPQ